MQDLLGYQLAQAAILTTEAFDRSVGKPLGLRPVEFTMLQIIKDSATATATQLARMLAVTTPAITGWLDRLEERGLVRRERGEHDRRTQTLVVTAEGAALIDSALRELLREDRELLKPLSEGERHMLLELLQKLARTRRW